MALAIDGSSPAAVQITTSSASGTTASFTPPAGARLIVSVNYWTAASVSLSDSQALGWTRKVQESVQATETAEIWESNALTANSSMTVTVTPNASDVFQFKVYVFTGADVTESAGASNVATSASGTPSLSLTTTRDGSWIVACATDDNEVGSGTAGSGQTYNDGMNAVGSMSSHIWSMTAAIPTSGTNQTVNLTAPAGQAYNMAALEILAAAAVSTEIGFNFTLLVPPGRFAPNTMNVFIGNTAAQTNEQNPNFSWDDRLQPRRIRGLLPIRGKPRNYVPNQQVVVAPDFVDPTIRQSIRVRALRLRRGNIVEFIPDQVTFVNPDITFDPTQTRRIRGLYRRIGKGSTFIPDQVAPPATPNLVFSPSQVRRLRGAKRVRGSNPVAREQDRPITETTQPRRIRNLNKRRPTTITPVPTSTVVPNPNLVFRSGRRPVGKLLKRGRGSQPSVVTPQRNPPNPIVVSKQRRVLRGWKFNRRRYGSRFNPIVVIPQFPGQLDINTLPHLLTVEILPHGLEVGIVPHILTVEILPQLNEITEASYIITVEIL